MAYQRKKAFLGFETSNFGEMEMIEESQRTSVLIPTFSDFRKLKMTSKYLIWGWGEKLDSFNNLIKL